MAYHGGRYFGPRYFGPRYWGSQGIELPPGSISGSALGAATANGNLTALGQMTASTQGLAAAMASLTGTGRLEATSAGVASTGAGLTAIGRLTGSAQGAATATGTLTDGGGAPGFMTGSAQGVATVTGDLTFTGAPADLPSPGVGTGSGGPSKLRRKKRKRTVEEELELARLRGTLRKLEDLWSGPVVTGLPSWEEMADELNVPVEPEPAKRSAKPGPAFMIPETDSFEKITDASRRVIDQLLEEARRNALRDQEARKAAQIAEVQRALEDDEDDLEELLLLDFL